MGSSVCALNNINAFNSCPIRYSNYYRGDGYSYGSIYVPSSLLTDYQAATNWVTISSRFVGI